MKKICFFLCVFCLLFVFQSSKLYSRSNSYLDSIYKANDSQGQCIEGVNCPEDLEKDQCIGDECETEICEGEECETEACEGEECETDVCEGEECESECNEETCPEGECIDGKCVESPAEKLARILRRVQELMNDLINRIINRISGINVGVKVVDMPDKEDLEENDEEVAEENESEAEQGDNSDADENEASENEDEAIEDEEEAVENGESDIDEEEEINDEEEQEQQEAEEYKEHTNFEAAQKAAREKDQPIMMVFSGSDWCGWCKKFRAEVLNQKPFQDYAKSNMETFIADFPRTTEQPAEISEQNERLASEYNVSGFPTVVIITPEGEVIEKTGYKEGGAENYVNHLKDILE